MYYLYEQIIFNMNTLYTYYNICDDLGDLIAYEVHNDYQKKINNHILNINNNYKKYSRNLFTRRQRLPTRKVKPLKKIIWKISVYEHSNFNNLLSIELDKLINLINKRFNNGPRNSNSIIFRQFTYWNHKADDAFFKSTRDHKTLLENFKENNI